jgi:hypothetical protein
LTASPDRSAARKLFVPPDRDQAYSGGLLCQWSETILKSNASSRIGYMAHPLGALTSYSHNQLQSGSLDQPAAFYWT